MTSSKHQSRIRWQCRRGMLELDVLLLNFFEQHYQELSAEEKIIFERLLQCTDPELFAWLMGKAKPNDDELAMMVEKIRIERNQCSKSKR